MKEKKEIFAKNYGIITHADTTGPAQNLYRYLKQNKVDYTYLIEHSFAGRDDRKTHYTRFESGKENKDSSLDCSFLPSPLRRLKDFIYSSIGMLRSERDLDVLVGVGGFNALAALLVRKTGKADEVVFWTIDYVPERFDNPVMNKIYHWIDHYCVKNCDEVWNLSPRMAEGREEHFGIDPEEYPQKVVPNGIWEEDVPDIEGKYDNKTLAFVGSILEKQGIQLVLKAIPEIVEEIEDFQFIVMGDGPYKPKLEELAKDLGIEEYVYFRGRVSDEEMFEVLGKSHLGVALYNEEKDSFTYYADPLKIKEYLSLGLPILTTSLPYNSEELQDEDVGIIAKYQKNDIVNSVLKILDEDVQENRKSCSKQYITDFYWDSILDENLGEIIYDE